MTCRSPHRRRHRRRHHPPPPQQTRASSLALARYRALKAFAADPCGADPASFTEAQCLWKDNGCGQACLDDRAGEYEKKFRPVLTVPAAS